MEACGGESAKAGADRKLIATRQTNVRHPAKPGAKRFPSHWCRALEVHG